MQEDINASCGKFVFDEHGIFVLFSSTSCHLLIFFSRNFVKFVKCVYSRGPCVREVCGSAGGAEGRESMGVWFRV